MAGSKRLPRPPESNYTPVVKRIPTLKVLAWALLACTLVWISVVLRSHVEIDKTTIDERTRVQLQQQFIDRVQHLDSKVDLDLDISSSDWREIEERVARADGSLEESDYFSFLDKHVNIEVESLVDSLMPKVYPSASHIVTVTDCTLLHDWQSLLLFYSASLVGQHGNFTRIVANCNEKAQFELFNQYLRKWPNYSIHFCARPGREIEGNEAYQKSCVKDFVNTMGNAISRDASVLIMPVEAVFLQGGPRGRLHSLGSASTAFEVEHPRSLGHTVYVSRLTEKVVLSDPSKARGTEEAAWALVDSLGSHAACEMPHRAVHPDDQPLVLVVPKDKEYRLEEFVYSASLFDQASSRLFQCDAPLLKDVDPKVALRPTHAHSHYPEDQGRKHNARTTFVLCHLVRVLNGFLSTIKKRFCSANDPVNYDREFLLANPPPSSL